jgi:hypothetical protein
LWENLGSKRGITCEQLLHTNLLGAPGMRRSGKAPGESRRRQFGQGGARLS